MSTQKKNSRTRNTVINIITSFAAQGITIFLSFAVRTVFIHTLGTTYLGVNSLFSDILSMLSLTELGLDTAMAFKLYKPLAEKNTPRLRVLMKFYRLAYMVVAGVFIVLGLILIPLLPFFIKDFYTLAELGINANLIFILYLFQSATSYLFMASRAAIIRADQKNYITTSVGMVVLIIRNVVQIISLKVFCSFIIYTVVTLFFSIVQNIITGLLAKRMYSDVFEKTDDKMSLVELRSTFKDLGALFVYKVNSVVVKATDNLVLSKFIGITIIGLYSTYLLFYSAIKSLLSNIYSSCKASMGNLFATSSIEKQYTFFELMNFISILLYGTACIGIAICSNELIECWLGLEYVLAQPIPMLIGIEILFAGIQINLGQIRNITGLYKQMWYRPIIGIIINIIVSIALVFPLGIKGVIIGTITSYLFANFLVDPRIIHTYYFKNIKPVSYYYKKNILYLVVIGAIGIANYYLCKITLPSQGWLSVIVHILICGVVTPIALYVIFRNTKEVKYLKTIVKSIIQKV